MKQLSHEEFVVAELFGLEPNDLDSIRYENLNGSAVIHIRLKDLRDHCPECGYDKPKIKNYVHKSINHAVLSDRKCSLYFSHRRYQCPRCRKTYYEHNPFVYGSRKISSMTVKNILEDLRSYNETYTSIARRYNLSPTTVYNLFDEHVNMPRKTLPEMINIDEVFAFKSKNSKFVVILLDFKTKQPIDLLQSRRSDELIKYFSQIPLEERENVKVCCSDMYDGYRTAIKRCFPNCTCILDRFHLVQDINKRLDKIRIRIMKGQTKQSDEYYLLKKFNWMILKKEDNVRKGKALFDPNAETKFNQKLKQNVNFYMIRDKLWNLNDELSEGWTIRDKVYDFFDESTLDTAADNLTELIQLIESSKVPEIYTFAPILRKWRQEIINSFIVYDIEYKVDHTAGHVTSEEIHMSNGIIENRNAIVKVMKKSANGFTNWERFRNRVMYVLDKEATYSLTPLYKHKNKKKH